MNLSDEILILLYHVYITFIIRKVKSCILFSLKNFEIIKRKKN